MTTAFLGCGQLVTLRGPNHPHVGPEMLDLGIVENGGLLIRDSLIEAVGTTEEITQRIEKDTVVVNAQGKIVTPGFVDAHTHPVFAGNRVAEYEQRSQGETYEQIAQKGGGIMSTVRQTRAATEEDLFQQSRRYADWFLQNGTTTVEAKSGYGLTLEDELKMLRVIRRLDQETNLRYIPTFLGAHSIPADQPNYVQTLIEQMLPAIKEQDLAEYCDIFCEHIACDIETSRQILTEAKKHGLKLRMHADQLTCGGGAQLAAELNAKTADHLEQTDARGIEALKRANVQPVLLPASVYALGKTKYPDARQMIDKGLAVVLATDFNPGSSPTPSMPMVLSLACTHMGMTPAEAFTAATINAAHSLDRAHQIGSLEPGKQADLVLWNLNDYREIPYFFGVNHIAEVRTHGLTSRGEA